MSKMCEIGQEYDSKFLFDLLISFICSLSLCDHMGDVMNDTEEVLDRLGLNIPYEEIDADGEDWLYKVAAYLGRIYDAKTLFGTSFADDYDEGDIYYELED